MKLRQKSCKIGITSIKSLGSYAQKMNILNLSQMKSLESEQKPNFVNYMDMNTKNNTASSTELLHIGDIGFMFEVNQALKHNLISPDVLAFFDGVQESEEVTEECAFPLPISNTNLHQSIFQYVGDDWVVCSDGIFRKCQKIKCRIEYYSNTHTEVFNIDRTLADGKIAGIISL